MKVCYVDESGNNVAKDPCLIMVGVLVDAYRLNRTREEFADSFDGVQCLFKNNLRELKGSKIFYGRDQWRNVDHDDRKKIIKSFCDWVVERKHHIALAALDRDKFKKHLSAAVPEQCHDEWLAGGLHIALQIQKTNQGTAKNKGKTFLIFDDNKAKADKLSDLLWQPPEWTDDYYKKNQDRLDQIVDTTFSIKSHHAGLVQVADLFAFILRRYAEMTDFGIPEKRSRERALVKGYVEILSKCLLRKSVRWPARPAGDSSRWFNAIAPASLIALKP